MSDTRLILLVNLGSPEELSISAIRKFLRKFLSDRRVVGLPGLIWYPLLFGIILPVRARKLLTKYQQIWRGNESPLTYYTRRQAQLLQVRVGDAAIVDHAFCYSKPDIAEALQRAEVLGVSKLVILPLYPQNSSSTTMAVYDQIARYYSSYANYYLPAIDFIASFATDHKYIRLLVDTIKSYWQHNGRGKKLIISFHSLPLQLITAGDHYLQECQATYQLLCKALAINPESEAILSFQSKFGTARWLTPATSGLISLLAKEGVDILDVVCPGFVSDCLETLEEIALQNRQLFIDNGGCSLNYIPCLNDNEQFIEFLHELTIKNN